MCGIAGATSDLRGRRTRLMLERLEHRGPDDRGVHTDSETGFSIGATRLSVIDVAGGHQPVSNEDGTVRAVLNGEIFNHPELQVRLERAGHRLRSRVDTEVLVHLYEDYGDELVHALEGMYCFAIWDARRRRLLLARDRFGEKPLFYRAAAGEFTFASELTGLRRGVADVDDLDAEAVDAFFVLGYVPGSRSIAEGVTQLRPGCRLVWNAAEPHPRVSRYWSLPDAPVADGEPREALVGETRELLERSVRGRLLADVPLGILLSGGTDSTLLAALAARARPGIKTFTVRYDVGAVSEAAAAREVAGALGTEHHEVTLGETELARLFPELVQRVDQPIADPAFVALHAVSRFAREHVKVAVGGEGADEIFGGYPRYRWLERAQRLEALPDGVRSRLAELLRAHARGRSRRLADVLEPVPDARRHIDWVTDGRASERGRLYGPRLQEIVDREVALEDAQAVLDGLVGSLPDRFMRLDAARWLPDDVLVKADRASMLTSLELRTPFLHRELAEMASRIPASVHLGGGGKALLRGVLRQVAPQVSSSRAKAAFRVPAGDWLRGPLAERLEEHVEAGPAVCEGWFARQALRETVADHRAGGDRTAVLWPFLTFSLWLQRWKGAS